MKYDRIKKRILAVLTAACVAATTIIPGMSTVTAADIQDTLAADYAFDGNLNDSVNPATAATAVGTNAPAVANDDIRGQVLSSKASSNSSRYLKTENPLYNKADLADTGATISFWINPESIATYAGLWCFSDGQGFYGMAGNGRIYYNNLAAEVSGGTTSFQDMSDFDTILTAKSGWQFITVTLTGNSVSIYKNGALQRSIVPRSNTGETGADMLKYIASVKQLNFGLASIFYPWGSTAFKMDNFRIYAQAMDASQVQAEYLADPIAAADVIKADKEALSLPGSVNTDLALPGKGASGFTTITWSSGNTAVITDDGAVTRPTDKDVTVDMTATISLESGAYDTVTIPVIVLKQNPDADIVEFADALTLNAGYVSSDLVLPAKSGQASVAWKSSSTSVISNDGKITRHDTENKTATLTATLTLEGTTKKEVREFPLTVLAKGSSLLSYISKTPATGQSGGMKIAAFDGGYTALHSDQPVLYSNQGTRSFSNPQIFRMSDGSFGVIAADGGNNNKFMLYESKDLITYSSGRMITVPEMNVVKRIYCVYDSRFEGYKLFCQNAEGKTYLVTTEDFIQLSNPVISDYSIPDVTDSLPEDANQYAAVDLTQAEYDAVVNKFGTIENTGIDVSDLRINKNGNYKLPETVAATYSDGSSKDMGITWNEDDIKKIDTSKAGTYTVNGTIDQFKSHTDADAPLIPERADPFITYNEDDGYYYFTASYPMHGGSDKDGYDRLILRRAKTIEGLADAQEVAIWDENMDDGSGASGHDSYGRFIWAPELHKIGGSWYFVSTAGDDPEGNNFNIRPFMLKCENPDDMMNPESWGKPQRVKPMSGDSGCMKAMSLDMSHFTAGGKDYLVWADVTQGDSSLYIATIDPKNPTQLTSRCSIITIPEYPWERVNNRVDEGAAILKHNGKVYMAFSASGTGMEYCIGLLTANEGDDLLKPASWQKTVYPILTSGDFNDEVSGPGHNSFTVDKDGNPILVYHARPTKTHTTAGGVHNGDPLYDPCRHCFVKAVNFSADGTPVLNMTENQELNASNKSVQIKVIVSDTEQEIKLTDLRITAQPEKRDYKVGEKFDPAGMKVTAYYENGTDKEIKISDLKYSDKAFDKAGTQNVVISYTENNVTKEVSVSVNVTEEVKITDPILEYNFNEKLSGTTVKDSAGSNDAKINGKAVYEQDPDYGQVLYLDGGTEVFGNNSYLEFPEGFFDNRNNMTISMDMKEVTRSGYYFTFGIGQDNQKYLFLKTDPEAMKLAITTSSNGGEKIAQLSSAYPNNSRTWINVKIVVTPNSISLYRNGELVAQNANTSTAISNLGTNLKAYIGKSFYEADKYFRGYFDNVKVYDQAMNAEQVKLATAKEKAAREEWKYDLKRVSESFSIPNADNILGNISLPEKIDGATVTWKSSDETVISTKKVENKGYDPTPAGVVTRQNTDKKVTLTAVFSKKDESSVTKTYDVTVKAKPTAVSEEDYAGYLFVHFTGNEANANHEQTYFSVSRDGLNWKDLNENKPVLTSTFGESGLRDHYIARSPEGDKFYMIATDLSIFHNNQWMQAGSSGSHSIVVWESEDLVNWSDPWLAEIAPENAGCTWAPEFVYDEKTGEYVVYWSATSLELDENETITQEYENHTIYYCKTRDFRTFTDAKVYHSGGKDASGKPIKVIDSTMIEEDGTYYRYTKNESNGTIVIDQSDSVLGEFTDIESKTLSTDLKAAQGAVEGPIIFKMNEKTKDGKDQWCLMVDRYAKGAGYYPLITTDLASGDFTMLSDSDFSMPSKYRHGYVMPITADEYERLTGEVITDKKVTLTYTADEGGKIEGEAVQKVTKGTDGTEVTAVADEGYEFVKWSDGVTTAKRTDKNVQENLSVTAEFKKKETPNKPIYEIFEDIDKDAWYVDYVQYVYDKGIMTGLTKELFGPNVILARSHFATMLYRMEGEPKVEYTDRFADVPEGEFYTNPVIWASSDDVNIISGYEDGNFGPNDNITREQMAVMLYRYANNKKYDTKASDDLKGFPDSGKVSDFAKDAMKWAVAVKLFKGEGDDGKLNPQGQTSRAVCATIMQRFLTTYEK